MWNALLASAVSFVLTVRLMACPESTWRGILGTVARVDALRKERGIDRVQVIPRQGTWTGCLIWNDRIASGVHEDATMSEAHRARLGR